VRRTFVSTDAMRIEAFVTLPRAYPLGSPPPLVLFVHGGPNGQSRGAFAPIVQALSQAGIAVAAVNYRGSTGYGRAFEDANNHDWGGRDLDDLVAVADTLATEGRVDRARTGIMGGSYGGYMTLRALTARPERFAAGVDLYGMADLAEDYRLTASRFGAWYQTEMGDPVRDAALYRDRSPWFTLERVRAPLLVMQGANDSNVPRVESDELVRRLRMHGARVEYVVYPGEGHGFSRRDDREDSIVRAVAFFARELGVRR
jgi:dipeptidyl aminopeptidase/acylaminoacyl peptidase